MQATSANRFLDPKVLTGISGLDLIAKTVVDGFVAGLHRSPDFGFSQEFAEYRAYTPGDDLRHVDWNVFARTERAYLKLYRGETNSLLTVLLDASQSMQYASHAVNKMDYARFVAASLFYLAIHNQRDAAGLIVFDDEVRNYIRPSTRQGQLHRLLAGLEQAEPRARTDFMKPLAHFQEFLRRRGVVRISVPAPGREMMGFLAPWFLAGLAAVGLPVYIHLLRRQTTTPRPVSSLMFFERGIQSSIRHRRLRYLL